MQTWFGSRQPGRLLYSFSKYKCRRGWGFRDVLRLTKPVPLTAAHKQAYEYACTGEIKGDIEDSLKIQYESIFAASNCTDGDELSRLLQKYGRKIAREHIPTPLLALPGVWNVMFKSMPATAMLRNINKVDFDQNDGCYEALHGLLGNEESIKKARLNPVNLLIAALTYRNGRGLKSSSTWKVNSRVSELLDNSVEKSMKVCCWPQDRIELGLDISGSMSMSFGDTPMSCAMMTAVIARLALLKDPDTPVYGFSDKYIDLKGPCKGYGTTRKGYIGSSTSWTDLSKRIKGINFGGTDPSLPILHAIQQYGVTKKKTKAFIIITDNDVGGGFSTKAHHALYQYRKLVNDDTIMMIVIGLTADIVHHRPTR